MREPWSLYIDELILDGVPARPGLREAIERELRSELTQLAEKPGTPAETGLQRSLEQAVGRALSGPGSKESR